MQIVAELKEGLIAGCSLLLLMISVAKLTTVEVRDLLKLWRKKDSP